MNGVKVVALLAQAAFGIVAFGMAAYWVFTGRVPWWYGLILPFALLALVVAAGEVIEAVRRSQVEGPEK